MLIEQRPLAAITPYPDNPREIPEAAVQGVAESIRRYGFRQPIVVDAEGVIIVGHVRLLAALLLRLETAPVHVADLTPDEARAYRLADNRSNENATWDDAGLLSELQALASVADNDLSELAAMTAFGERELQALLLATIDPEPDEVAPPEPRAKAGDLWVLGRHRLLCGDSETMFQQVGTGLERGMVLTDPPYGIGIVKDGAVGVPGLAQPRQYMEIANDDRPFDPTWIIGLGAHQIIFGVQHFASKLRDGTAWICWDKGTAETAMFSGFELAWTSFEGRARMYRHKWSGMIREGERQVELADRIHPTQKPVGLIEQILADMGKDYDLILDPFVGSGTTIIAAERQQRACYAMEIEPRYVDMAIARWEDLTGETAVLETS